MAYHTGIAQGCSVRDGAVARDEPARSAGWSTIAVARAATGGAVDGAGLEAAYAVTAPTTRCGVEGMKAATAAKPATPATTKTAATAVKAATPAAVTATAAAVTATPATTGLGSACERQRHDRDREDPSERQRNLFAANSSQHIFLHHS